MKVYSSLAQLVGHTPLLRLSRIEKECNLHATVYAKLECFNPAGSVKDRVALAMIEEVEKSGKLKQGGTIIEPTSGNTGIGLCAIANSKGYKTVIVMPDNMSVERQKLMKAYGATLILTPASEGMAGAIRRAEEVQKSTPNAIVAGQFTNPANPEAHYLSTGREIYGDTDGGVDIFVAGVGTGGTITGTGRYLKEQNPAIHVIAVEPKNSPVLSGGKAGAHGLQGIGAGFVPEVLDKAVYDEVFAVTEGEAYEAGRLLAKKEGVLCGISSGASLYAAIEVAKRPENAGKNVVVLLPDTGDRYLSTPLFEE